MSDGIVHIHTTAAARDGGRNDGIITRTHVSDGGAEVLKVFFREGGGAGSDANTTGAGVGAGESSFDHFGSVDCGSVIGGVGAGAGE